MSAWDDWLSGWRDGLRRGLERGGRALLALAERVASPEPPDPEQAPVQDDPAGGPPAHWRASLPANEPPADWLARVQGQSLASVTAEPNEETADSDSPLPAQAAAEDDAPLTQSTTPPPKQPAPRYPPRRSRRLPFHLRWPARTPPQPPTEPEETAEPPPPTIAAPAQEASAPPPASRPARLHFVARQPATPLEADSFPAAAPKPASERPSAPPVEASSQTPAIWPEATQGTAVSHPPTFPDRPTLASEPVQSRRKLDGSHHAKPVDQATKRLADSPQPQPPPPPFPDRTAPPTPARPRWPNLPDEDPPATNEWEQSLRQWQHWHRLQREQEGETWNGSSF